MWFFTHLPDTSKIEITQSMISTLLELFGPFVEISAIRKNLVANHFSLIEMTNGNVSVMVLKQLSAIPYLLGTSEP